VDFLHADDGKAGLFDLGDDLACQTPFNGIRLDDFS